MLNFYMLMVSQIAGNRIVDTEVNNVYQLLGREKDPRTLELGSRPNPK
jgi:hypothetical protein